MPQLLTSARGIGGYDAELAENLSVAQGWEREDRREVEEDGGDHAEDGMPWCNLYNAWHYAGRVGVMYVLDETALVAAHESESSGGIRVRVV